MQFETGDRRRTGKNDGPRRKICLFHGQTAVKGSTVIDRITGFGVLDFLAFSQGNGKIGSHSVKIQQSQFGNDMSAQSHVPIPGIAVDHIAVYIVCQITHDHAFHRFRIFLTVVSSGKDFDLRIGRFQLPADHTGKYHHVEHRFGPGIAVLFTVCHGWDFDLDIPCTDPVPGVFMHDTDTFHHGFPDLIGRQRPAGLHLFRRAKIF